MADWTPPEAAEWTPPEATQAPAEDVSDPEGDAARALASGTEGLLHTASGAAGGVVKGVGKLEEYAGEALGHAGALMLPEKERQKAEQDLYEHHQQVQDRANRVADSMTYQPRSEAGQGAADFTDKVAGLPGEAIKQAWRPAMSQLTDSQRDTVNAVGSEVNDVAQPLLAMEGAVRGGAALKTDAPVAPKYSPVKTTPRGSQAVTPEQMAETHAQTAQERARAAQPAAATSMGPTSVGAAQATPAVKEPPLAPPREEGARYRSTEQTDADRETRLQHLSDLNGLAGGTLENVREGAISGDWDKTGTEYQNAKIDDKHGQRMQQQFATEQEALHNATTNVFDSLGSTAKDSVDPHVLEHRGEIANDFIHSLEDHHAHQVDALYDQARAYNGGKGMPALPRLSAFLNDDANFIGDQQRSLQGAIKTWRDRLWSTGDPERNIPAGSVNGAERLREIINDNFHPDSKVKAKQMKSLLDQDVATHVGGPSGFEQARAALQKKETQLDPKGIDALRRPEDRNGIDDTVPLHQVMDHITRLPRKQFEHIMNVAREATTMGSPALAEKAASFIRETQAHIVSRMHDAATGQGGAWSADNFYKEASRYSTKLPSAFKENPQVLGQIATINHAGNVLKMDKSYPGAVAQGTKTGLVGLAGRAAKWGSGALGLHGGGPVGGIVGHVVGGAAEKGAEAIVSRRRGAMVNSSLSPLNKERGAIGDFSKLPQAEHSIDEDGQHVVKSANGTTLARDRGNDIQVTDTKTAETGRGNGEAVARMAKLADAAHARGGKLLSDTQVSAAGQKVYPALAHMGYDVKPHTAVERWPDGKLVSADTRPVFTVGPKNQRGSVKVAPDRRGPSRNVSDDEHFQLLRKMQNGTPLTLEEQKKLTSSLANSKTFVPKGQQGKVQVMSGDDKPAMVNIGLHQGDPANGGRVMEPKEVVNALRKQGVRVGQTSTHISNSEPTLVASIHRPLTAEQGDRVAKQLKQTAIAQRTGHGEGNMLGEGARSDEAKANGWDKYNSDYFMMHDGDTAAYHESPYDPSRGQTVMNPQRNAYPGIYESPDKILSRVQTAPEDPIMKQLFGVSRKDLHDTAMSRINAAQDYKLPGAAEKATGSRAAGNVMTEHNAARLRGIIEEAKKNPDLYHGMVGWYVMDPLYKAVAKEIGNKAAPASYARLNHLMGMASPGSDVMTEMNRGTAANMMASKGEFDKFEKYGGKPEDKRGKGFPDELRAVKGHPYHSTAQAGPMRKYLDKGELDMKSPKVPTYIASSAMPGKGFQNKVLVGDSHWSRGVGLSDVRTNQGYAGSVSNPEISQLHPWYKSEVADKVGLPPTSAQAVQWGALSKETGVETPVGAPKLELFAQSVAKAAKRNGVTPEEQLKRIIRGMAHAG